jgi:hypothetical protein
VTLGVPNDVFSSKKVKAAWPGPLTHGQLRHISGHKLPCSYY